MNLPPGLLPTLLAAFVLLVVFGRARRFGWVFVLLVLPATLMHELCHWIVAWLSGAQPSRFSVWPRREADRMVLGEVTIRRGTWLTRGLVGLAPLCLLPVAVFGLLRLPAAESPAQLAGHAWLFASLLYGSLPSFTDLRLALRGLPGALLMLALNAGLLWLFWRGAWG